MISRVINLLKNILGKIKRLPRVVLYPSLFILFMMAGAGVFFGFKGYNYMEYNPNFCRSCHTMEDAWNRWSTSEHRSITCHSCHETTVIEGTEQLIKFSLNQPERVGKHARVNDESCTKCHESGNTKWEQIADTAGHLVHAEEQNIACTKCHAVSVHRFAPPKKVCEVCHEDSAMAVTAMASQHCSSCHGFLKPATNGKANNGSGLSGKPTNGSVPDDKVTNGSLPAQASSALLPDRESCLSCHAALKVSKVTWPENAPMKVDCLQCHKPHEQAKPIVDCLSCHAGQREKGLHQAKAHSGSACQTCHQPHEWVIKTRSNCETCHQDKAEHFAGALCSSCHDFRGVKK